MFRLTYNLSAESALIMEMSGEYKINAPREKVWDALNTYNVPHSSSELKQAVQSFRNGRSIGVWAMYQK